MTDELQTQPPVPAKNKGGRPRKDKVADSLKETLRQIESLLLLDHPSPAKSRLLGAKLEFYMGEQKFEREQKKSNVAVELEEARLQVKLDKLEIEHLSRKIQELTKGES
jgi:hypothetical protein